MSDIRGMARASDPATSKKAAAAIIPRRYTIRQQVEEFAKARPGGFTDDDLEEEFPTLAASSWRTRRSELAQDNVLFDTGSTRENAAKREMIVWTHRDFHPNPPPIHQRKPQESQRGKIVRLEAQERLLIDLLANALPFVEDAKDDGTLSNEGKDRAFSLARRIKKAVNHYERMEN